MNATRVVFHLGAQEVQYCALLAERRNVIKAPHGVRSQRFCDNTDFGIHMIGVMGEYATAKHFGVKVDTEISLSGDDKVSDLEIGDYRVQIKTRLPQRPPLYLYFNSLDLFRADRAVCALVPGPATVELVGWMDRERFAEEARPINFGYGVRYAVPEDRLQDMGEW